MIALALTGLVQAGCKSDGCSTCGIGSSIATGFRAVGSSVKAVGAFVFHHKKGCGGGNDCGCSGEVGGIEEGVIVDQGIPVVPGGMVMPPSSTLIPPPSIESEPTQLKPLDGSPANPTSGTSSGTPSTSTSKPTTSRSNPIGSSRPGYTTGLPKNNTTARRGSETDQSLYSASNTTGRVVNSNPSGDLLDNIPPVDLSSEVTRKAVTTPAKAASTGEKSPETSAPTPAEKLSAVDGATLTLPPITAVNPSQAPGLKRFAPIAPSIAGGSAPSIEGLDWLKEKGYRTLLDLRKSSEVDPNFVDAVNDRGMVYISLSIMATRLDPSRLARFDDLISRSENRPLFFCDVDGSRAALAWYIHERVVGHEEAQAALAKVEELGLGTAEVKLAEDYLAVQKPKAKAAMARVAMATAPPAPEVSPDQAAAPDPVPVVTPPALPETPTAPPKASTPPEAPLLLDEVVPSMLPGEHRPQDSNIPPVRYDRDPAAWRPVAALVLTSIGVPLAFWGRTMFNESRTVRRRASLPAAALRSLEAPGALDA